MPVACHAVVHRRCYQRSANLFFTCVLYARDKLPQHEVSLLALCRMIFDLPGLVKGRYDLQRAAFQPLLELHELGDRALRPVVQGVRHIPASSDRTEVQNQLVATVDVHVPPEVDKVPILAVHRHRREMARRRLHGLVPRLVLPALFLAPRANAERHDVELHDVLKQKPALQKEATEVLVFGLNARIWRQHVLHEVVDVLPETRYQSVPRVFARHSPDLLVFLIQVPEAVRDPGQHVVHLHDVQEHVDVHQVVRVLRALRRVRLREEPGVLPRRDWLHHEGNVAVVDCVVHRKRAFRVHAGLREHHPRDAHRGPARLLPVVAVGIQVAFAGQRVRLDVRQQFGRGVVPPVRNPAGALRPAAQVVGQRPASIDSRVRETNVARH